MAFYSLIIRNGKIIDGKMGERGIGDIGINKETIAKVGDLSNDIADEIINAEGKFVSPGFIDLTSHSDTHWTLFTEPGQESVLTQGITTILGGNCGFSLAPLVRQEVIEGLRKWIDVSAININWQSFDEFLAELEKRFLAVNFASLIGLGTLRRGVIGNAGRTVNDIEAKEMIFLLDRSMKDGAFGLSTSLGRVHEKNASETELKELLQIIKNYEGLAKHHLKDEGKEIMSSLAQIIGLARESGARTQISHFKILGRQSWDNIAPALSMIEHGREEEKLDLWLDFFPYEKTGSNLYLLLPPWLLEEGGRKIISRLKEPETRKNVADYLKNMTLHYDKMILASTLRDKTGLGKTLLELSQKTGLNPEELIIELLEINELKVSIFNEVINPQHLIQLAAKKYSLFATDGLGISGRNIESDFPHPRSFGAFPKCVNLFVNQKRILTLEEAIYKMTGLPARNLGLNDRGTIETGKKADLVVFDLDKIEDRADYQNPVQFSEGINYVLVNGKIAVREGKPTAIMAGKVLRK
ncbi:MAG: hypothetical protein A3H02_01715 [Candidatus Niyogibacteria bacterium RIFCSPLOWO2_12_FULL_41_13]|uniref:Amidohydrolase 3 domain-containing protein n=1 Tax=Candidatus Niyogibacteria bacterium RIFCSPLOWO2_12_FULL_41_13 TaxID=1801726 RepID=A0A1G2F1X0_9BACT|nr:MAG: hypothetical protein A3H02_01715 [Candidatus Niyogibacteria bacterium RIFCSPLOWO2_12_FULL_41_13]